MNFLTEFTFEDIEKRELIDVLIEKEEDFKKLKNKAVKRKSNKITFYIADLSDIEKMKRSSSRPIDLADLTLIQELKKIKTQKKGNKTS